jgi:hypothetical protein
MTDHFPHLHLHHIGCLTTNIEAAIKSYSVNFGIVNIKGPIHVLSQQCEVCFLQLNCGINFELIQPNDTESALGKLVKKGTTYYHLAYLTDNIEESINSFIGNKGVLIDKFESEAFENRKCAFLYTDLFHLIELIQSESIVK